MLVSVMSKGIDPVNEQEIYKDYDFSSMSTPGFASFLSKHNISLAITSYSCHRLVVLRTLNSSLDTYLVPVARPFGLAVQEQQISIASYSEVIHYNRSDNLLERAAKLDSKFIGADALYLPYDRHITGYINLHDMEWCGEELWFVNSRHGCISSFTPGSHFTNRWFPYFYKEQRDNSSNHLNGMAVKDGVPVYASCFHTLKRDIHWKTLNQPFSGGIIDVATNELIVDGLSAPHSPRVFGDYLYFCNSGVGTVERIHLSTGKREVLMELPGYARGLMFYQDKMLVCTSKVRESNAVVELPIYSMLEETAAGIFIVDTNNFEVIDYVIFTGDIQQIYDIKVIENCLKPEIPGIQDEILLNLQQTTPDNQYKAF